VTTTPANLDDVQSGAAAPWAKHHHQSHWRNNEDEFDAAKLGMWLFLSTEILLFSGMFVAYAILRGFYPDAFKGASAHYLDWRVGAVNTAVLLLSSFTVAMSVRNAQLNQQGWLRINLFISIICGVFFLVTKLVLEYWPKYTKGELPGGRFTYGHADQYAQAAYEPMFLSVYWVATAIHGLHVLVGILLLGWVLLRSMRLHFGPRYYTPVEIVGLYWHLVDLIWIFLFPMLYLAP